MPLPPRREGQDVEPLPWTACIIQLLGNHMQIVGILCSAARADEENVAFVLEKLRDSLALQFCEVRRSEVQAVQPKVIARLRHQHIGRWSAPT